MLNICVLFSTKKSFLMYFRTSAAVVVWINRLDFFCKRSEEKKAYETGPCSIRIVNEMDDHIFMYFWMLLDVWGRGGMKRKYISWDSEPFPEGTRRS